MQPLLEVTGLRVRYGGVVAVDGLDFSVNEGEVVAMIGANGAGKSTTLMALSGIIPSEGVILFQGESLQHVSPADRVKRGIVQVPEGRRIFSRLSVRENLLMGSFLRRDGENIQRDLDEVLSLFPILSERVSQPGGTLSGGEQQMLAIARGLMSRPKLMLLDEPSLGLSPIFSKLIFTVIDKLAKEGRSILLVEQNARAALRISRRGYCLETGRIFLSGYSKELSEDSRVREAYLGG